MEKVQDATGFSKEERAEISKKFREEMKQHGLGNAILSVVESSSNKLSIRKNVFVQQCRKPTFATEFKSVCKRLADAHPSLAVKILELRSEVTGSK